MIEFTYLGHGYWVAQCSYCGTWIETQSAAEAQVKARNHERSCGQ